MLDKSFDKPVLSKDEGLRTNGKWLIPFVGSVSNHERNQLIQHLLNAPLQYGQEKHRCFLKTNPYTRIRQSLYGTFGPI